MKQLGAVAILVGCASPVSHPSEPPPDTADARTCALTTTLTVGASGVSQQVTLGTDSIGWCLQLDNSTSIESGDFIATTGDIPGDQTDVELVLLDGATLTELVSGSDTPWTLPDGTHRVVAYSSLLFEVATGQSQSVILRARALVPRTVMLYASVSDPTL